MIQGVLIKIVVPLIRKIFFELFDQQAKVYKFKNTMDYMELPNEADRGILKLQDQNNILAGTIKEMTKDFNTMQNNVKDLMKIVKNTKKIRSL